MINSRWPMQPWIAVEVKEICSLSGSCTVISSTFFPTSTSALRPLARADGAETARESEMSGYEKEIRTFLYYVLRACDALWHW